jgi:hypothetical protein
MMRCPFSSLGTAQAVVFAVLFGSLSAQPVLTSADLPQGGTTYARANAAPPFFAGDLGASGEDLTWDFSDILLTTDAETEYFSMGAASITTQFIFSSADHFTAFEIPDLGIENPLPISGATTYLRFGGDAYEVIGLGITTDIFDLPVIYDDEEELLPLPLTYGASLEGTSAFTLNLPELLYYQTAQSSVVEVDAWGTLLLPGGSYECLRVTRTYAAQDSVNVPAAELGFSLPREGTVYEWYAPGEGMPVLSVQEIIGIPAVWQFKPGEDVSDIPNAADTEAAFQVTPNPAALGGYVKLSCAEDGLRVFEVQDAAGQCVFKGEIEVHQGQALLPAATWTAGAYTVSTPGQQSVRFILE